MNPNQTFPIEPMDKLFSYKSMDKFPIQPVH